jgi:phosphoserine aminotransferase
MNTPLRPAVRPTDPNFSSGPCAKRPGWSVDGLKDAVVGRSHRSKPGKAKLQEVIERSRAILGIPEGWHIGIVPASDTGAFEMAMWSMIGARGVDVFSWESFGAGWKSDIQDQLKLDDVRIFDAGYGDLPDLAQADFARDVVFTWNGTTSGVRVPNGDWIADDREGLTFCDATSAVFAMDLPWEKLDVVTWSWQKVMGGEAQHGMLVLGPRAVERLESYTPAWPLPKIFRVTKGLKLVAGIFAGETINTPSMIAVEDALDGLKWGESIGGLKGLVGRTQANAKAIADWVGGSDWIDFLATGAATRSPTSVCLKVVDPWLAGQAADKQAAATKAIAALLDKEGVAYDIDGYRDAPPGLRIWAGATVETSNLEALFPWLDWAYATVKADMTATQ